MNEPADSATAGSRRKTPLTPNWRRISTCTGESLTRFDRATLPVLRRDIHVASTDAEARAHVDPILAQGYRGLDHDRLLVGSPDTIVRRLRRYESMGFDHVLVRHVTGDHGAMIASFELLGEVVAAVA